MKKFLNINKQRIFAFLFVMIFISMTCLLMLPQFAYAAEEDYPVGVFFNANVDSNMQQEQTIPINFRCGSDYKFIRTTVNGEWFYENDSTSLLVYDGVAWVSESYRYIYVTAFALDYENLEAFLQPLGIIVSYEPGYMFTLPLSLPDMALYGPDAFMSNGVSFTTFSRLSPSIWSRDLLTYYNSGDSTIVYEDGSWVNDAYRTITVEEFFVPVNYSQYQFWSASVYVPPSFFDRVTSGLSAVISWVGTVVTAIVSGELVALLPLVAIGIAVSALLLAWVFIRRFIWGS